MFTNHKFIDRSLLIIVDAILVSLFSIHFCRFVLKGKFYFTHEYYWMVPITVVLFILFSYIFERYESKKIVSKRNLIYQSYVLGLMFVLLILIMSVFYINTSFSRSKLLFSLTVFPVLITLWYYVFYKIISQSFLPFNSLLIYQFDKKDLTKQEILDSFSESIMLDEVESLDESSLSKKRDMVVVLFPERSAIKPNINVKLNKIFYNSTIVTSFISAYTEIKEAVPLRLGSQYIYNLLGYSISRESFHYRLFLVALNTLFCVLMMVMVGLTSVILLLLNPLLNKGPLFYKQKRLGKDQKEFYIYKFRTMVINAEKDGPKMSTKNDNRITSLGRFLRKTRLDETPQFYNVLLGDMNLIGPRPERKQFADELTKICFLYHYRHRIKPGITGWAQVKYKYGENFEDSIIKLEYDLYYVRRRNIVLDIRILLKTISSMILAKGM